MQLVAMDASGAEAIRVTLAAAQAPTFTQGQPVTPVGLTASRGRRASGTAWRSRAEQIKPAAVAKSA